MKRTGLIPGMFVGAVLVIAASLAWQGLDRLWNAYVYAPGFGYVGGREAFAHAGGRRGHPSMGGGFAEPSYFDLAGWLLHAGLLLLFVAAPIVLITVYIVRRLRKSKTAYAYPVTPPIAGISPAEALDAWERRQQTSKEES